MICLQNMWKSFALARNLTRTSCLLIRNEHSPTSYQLVSLSQIRCQSTGSSNQTDYSKMPKFEKPAQPKPQQTPKKSSSKFYSFLTVFASGAAAFVMINYALDYANKSKPAVSTESVYVPGRVVPSKSVKHEQTNPGRVKLTLYQYVTCPFCCKVRAYLDYFGYNYDIVEVNSISKKQLDWSKYKKVPVVTVQFPTKDNPDVYEDEFVQLNDSSMIISALETFRLDSSHSLKEIINYYQPVVLDGVEMNNKYFVMLYNDDMTDRKSLVDRKAEREWRSWVDEKFVHVISPNVYRTLNEAFEAFRWFDKAGEWEKYFSSWERNFIIYLGATVMYLLGKRLKYK